MSSKKAKTKTTKKRPRRATSKVFTMFDQYQIQEFKEAFNMINKNLDGFIDKEDLHDMLASLGKNPTGTYLDTVMPHQFHHVPHHVWREVKWHRSRRFHQKRLRLL
ncbi:Myosin regulatory light polypeptide 9 [Microtus ochrogaster]|uniref:Myosin regulatory light polypeptide 9 n=1 Tax=Microtus ochrogaster TaxID=79684 RepID=A0A8J6FZL4_MICOH|nr:Myosin regulatory light polypeptide 9 [Microtus ochrogaster]